MWLGVEEAAVGAAVHGRLEDAVLVLKWAWSSRRMGAVLPPCSTWKSSRGVFFRGSLANPRLVAAGASGATELWPRGKRTAGTAWPGGRWTWP